VVLVHLVELSTVDPSSRLVHFGHARQVETSSEVPEYLVHVDTSLAPVEVRGKKVRMHFLTLHRVFLYVYIMAHPEFTNSTGRTLLPVIASQIIDVLKLPGGTTFGARIGTPSVNGAIFPINGVDRVIKVGLTSKRIFENEGGRGDFAREVKIGRLFADMNANNRHRVGTPIHQSGTIELYNKYRVPFILTVYVMDNLLTEAEKQKGYTLTTLHSYYSTIYIKRANNPNTCPKNKITKMYTELLYFFYKGVKGWHGDLHSQNIQVILNPKGVPVRMVVIDYGSAVYFKNKNRLQRAKCLDQILDQIHEETRGLPVNASGAFWAQPHRENPGNMLRRGLVVKRGQLVYPNSAVVRNNKKNPAVRNNKKNHLLYINAEKRGYTKENLNRNAVLKARRNAVVKAIQALPKYAWSVCALGARACKLVNKKRQNAWNRVFKAVVPPPRVATPRVATPRVATPRVSPARAGGGSQRTPNTGRSVRVNKKGKKYVRRVPGRGPNYKRVKELINAGRIPP